VLRAEPDWTVLPSEVTPGLKTVIKRCLVKDRVTRIPDVSVVRFLIDDAVASQQLSSRAGGRSGANTMTFVGLVALIGMTVGGSWVWWIMRSRPGAPMTPAHFNLTLPSDLPNPGLNTDRSITIAPDGAHIVWVNRTAVGGQLMVRGLDQLEPAPVRGIAGAPRAPFISSDSRWIGYFDSGGDLKKVPMTGGPPITICRISGGTRGSAWGPDNLIVYATNDTSTGLAMVSADGGEPKILTRPDTAHGEVDHVFPSFLPGGRIVLFTIVTDGPIDNALIGTLDIKTGERKTLIQGASFAEYAASGHLLYASAGSLYAVRFDPDRLRILSDPVAVVDHLRTAQTGAAQFAVSQTGSLVYTTGISGNLDERALVWVDRHGREQPVTVAPRAYLHPRISPDGSRVAVAIADQEQDIWILDLLRPALTRLTFGSAVEQYPVWTPDGRRVVFRSDRSGIPNVFWQAADNTGTIEQLTFATQSLVIPHALTPDGNTLIVGTGSHIGIERLDNRQKITTVAEAQGSQGNAAVSPDGHWLAYNSTESGPPQIYVRPFPNVDAGRWQISTSGGFKPIWARNSQEVFYFGLAPESALMAVPVRINGTFTFGNPSKLFDGRPYFTAPPGRTYDVSPDGQKFLMIKAVQTAEANSMPPQAVLILNWFEELKARVPAK
jgi:eukaryotic-like serine/threonine-protein kinase